MKLKNKILLLSNVELDAVYGGDGAITLLGYTVAVSNPAAFVAMVAIGGIGYLVFGK